MISKNLIADGNPLVVKNSQLRNSQGLFNDGLTSTCANNGQTTWIYNQVCPDLLVPNYLSK
jgi:hypothetical protein